MTSFETRACGGRVDVLLVGRVTTHVYGRFVVVFFGGLQPEVGLGGRMVVVGLGGGVGAAAAALQHVKQLCQFQHSTRQHSNYTDTECRW